MFNAHDRLAGHAAEMHVCTLTELFFGYMAEYRLTY